MRNPAICKCCREAFDRGRSKHQICDDCHERVSPGVQRPVRTGTRRQKGSRLERAVLEYEFEMME
jgi:predicted amidophosphoribosyltransferase